MTPSPHANRIILNLAGGTVAGGLILMLGFCTWALIYREVPVSNRDALMVVIGILSMNVGQVVSFFYGSSSTSKQQAETIDTMAKTTRTQGEALNPPQPAVELKPGESTTIKADDS